MVTAGFFLSLNSPLPYDRRCISVNKCVECVFKYFIQSFIPVNVFENYVMHYRLVVREKQSFPLTHFFFFFFFFLARDRANVIQVEHSM